MNGMTIGIIGFSLKYCWIFGNTGGAQNPPVLLVKWVGCPWIYQYYFHYNIGAETFSRKTLCRLKCYVFHALLRAVLLCVILPRGILLNIICHSAECHSAGSQSTEFHWTESCSTGCFCWVVFWWAMFWSLPFWSVLFCSVMFWSELS